METRTCASRPGSANPRLMGRLGASACTITSHLVQLSLGRTCRITLKRAGAYSSTSDTSSPSLLSSPPQAGHAVCCGMCVATSRGRCSGSARRAGLRTAAAGGRVFSVGCRCSAVPASRSSSCSSSCSSCRWIFSDLRPNCSRCNRAITSLRRSSSASCEEICTCRRSSSSSRDEICSCCFKTLSRSATASNVQIRQRRHRHLPNYAMLSLISRAFCKDFRLFLSP